MPSNSDLQKAKYNGWLHAVFVTGCACFSADGLCIWANLNYYGSWNDSEMSRTFLEKLLIENRKAPGHGVIADTAFPATNEMFGKIISPLKEGEY